MFHEFLANADVQFFQRFQPVCEERRGDDGEFLDALLHERFNHLCCGGFEPLHGPESTLVAQRPLVGFQSQPFHDGHGGFVAVPTVAEAVRFALDRATSLNGLTVVLRTVNSLDVGHG